MAANARRREEVKTLRRRVQELEAELEQLRRAPAKKAAPKKAPAQGA